MVTRVTKYVDYLCFVKMERVFGAVVCVLLVASELCAQSPCPGIFDYQNEGGVLTGRVTVPPNGATSSIVTRVNFSITARLPSSYVGRLVPVDPEQGLQRYNRGAPLVYRVYFPVTSPLPHLTSLVVNGNELCYGPVDVPGPNQYVSTISLQHMLYLREGSPNSLFSLYDRPDSFEKPTQYPENSQVYIINDVNGRLTFRPFYDRYRYRPNQYDFYSDFTTEPKPRPPQVFYPDGSEETFNRQPPRRPQRPPMSRPQPDYPVQPDPQPQPDYPAQPQPQPDYYATQAPPQPPPDFNPYATERPPVPKPIQRPPANRPPANRPAANQGFSGTVECGVKAGGNDIVPLVMNGLSYERGEWPWLVAIYQRKDGSLAFKCGGTLVSDRHVVTAAHCMQQKTTLTSMRDIVVKVGVYNLEDWGDDLTVTRTLETATIHESYNATNLANDILVFTLNRRVEFTTNIRPACLWDGNTDLNRVVGASGVVVGWGKTELGPAGHGEPRLARLPIVSTSTCRASKPDFHKLTSDTTLCAGDRNGVGPCLGDSGGGLYLLDGGRWRLRGVVSLSLQPPTGERTCDLDQYVIFTDAAKYGRWIAGILNSSQF